MDMGMGGEIKLFFHKFEYLQKSFIASPMPMSTQESLKQKMLIHDKEHGMETILSAIQVSYFEKTVKIKKSNLFNYFVKKTMNFPFST